MLFRSFQTTASSLKLAADLTSGTPILQVDNSNLTYKNILSAQLPSSLSFFQKVILENNFSKIIELGTNRGGLTLWLNDNKKENSKIYS